LLELPSEERHGFIWALRDPDGVLDLDAHLGPLDAELAEWGFNYHIAGTLELEVKSNWKCSMEAFLETYHFPYVHATSIVNGSMSNVVTFDQLGRHHCLGVPARVVADMPEVPTIEMTSNIYYIYPCTVIAKSLLGGEMLQFYPGPTPSSSTIRHTMLSRKEVTGQVAEWYDEYRPKIQGAVRDEDAPVLERSGLGLAAGRTDVVLGRNEIGCQAAHRQILADLAAASAIAASH
jgi:phenylpropionate dioxygenase-like ring-hydroxylating dioxygenase large terminal subunit